MLHFIEAYDNEDRTYNMMMAALRGQGLGFIRIKKCGKYSRILVFKKRRKARRDPFAISPSRIDLS